jgi:hypothetical protein
LPDTSLLEVAQFLGSNTARGMALKVGEAAIRLPPPLPDAGGLSVRFLVKVAAQPLMPSNLHLQFGGADHPSGSKNVPVNNVVLIWDDPGANSIRKATFWNVSLKNSMSGQESGEAHVGQKFWGIPGTLAHGTEYYWGVTPFNSFGVGPPPFNSDNQGLPSLTDFYTQPSPATSWTLFLQAGPVPVFFKTLQINIDEVTWTVTPDWNSALAKTVTVKTPSAAATGSLNLPIPTGSVKTVTVSISGKASTKGGTVDYYSVSPQSFSIAADTEKVAFHGPNEHIGWSLAATYGFDKDSNLIFTASPTFAGIMDV